MRSENREKGEGNGRREKGMVEGEERREIIKWRREKRMEKGEGDWKRRREK